MSRVFRDKLFDSKVAFFTGGTSGIGLGIAQRFAELGATVVLTGRNEQKMKAAIAGIQTSGGNTDGFVADVRDYSAIEEILAQTRAQYGEIDMLFCAAAGNFPAPVLGMSANGFKAVIDIDLLGTFNTCRAAHQHLRKPGASVINISANHARIPYAYQAHVCAAKAGIDALARVLALEWGADGIRVNCITPGPIDETEGMRRLAPTEEMREQIIASVPLQRLGRCSDIADLATFLCSDAASYITGSVFVCDGGQSLNGSRSLAGAVSPVSAKK